MPVYGLRQRPPDPSSFRSTPSRSWTGLTVQRQRDFTSELFPNESCHERLELLSESLFGTSAPDQFPSQTFVQEGLKEEDIGDSFSGLSAAPSHSARAASPPGWLPEQAPRSVDSRAARRTSPEHLEESHVARDSSQLNLAREPVQLNTHMPRGSIPAGARAPPHQHTHPAAHTLIHQPTRSSHVRASSPQASGGGLQANTHMPRGSVPKGARPPPGSEAARPGLESHLRRSTEFVSRSPTPKQAAPARTLGAKAKSAALWDDDDSDFETETSKRGDKERGKRSKSAATVECESNPSAHGLLELPGNHYDEVAGETAISESACHRAMAEPQNVAASFEEEEEDDVWGRCVLPADSSASSKAPAKVRRSKEQAKCSVCGDVGHNKRKCPELEATGEGAPSNPLPKKSAESKKRKSRDLTDAGQLAPTTGSDGSMLAQQRTGNRLDKALQGRRVCTHLGCHVANDAMLDSLFDELKLQGCSTVVMSLLYASGHSHLRPSKAKDVGVRDVSGLLLLFPELSATHEQKGSWYLPLDEQTCYTTSKGARLALVDRIFGAGMHALILANELQRVLLPVAQALSPQTLLQSRLVCLSAMAWLLDPEQDRPSLDSLVQRYSGIDPVGCDDADKGPSNEAESEAALRLIFQDLAMCGQVYDAMWGVVEERGMVEACTLEMASVSCMALLETNGVGFSPSALVKHKKFMEKKLIDLEAEAAQIVGHPVLLTSPQQLCALLFDELKLPPSAVSANMVTKFKAANQQHTTNEETLMDLQKLHPLPGVILEHRHLTKMLSTFIIPLCNKAIKAHTPQGLSRIFSHWSQTSTGTGRLASSDPNLQNIPKHDSIRLLGRSDITATMNVRDAFIPRQGCVLLAGDYVQCELRVMAHFSKDRSLVQLMSGEGVCPYIGIAAKVLGKPAPEVTPQERSIFKTVVLGLLFGLGKKNLAAKLSMTEAEASKHITGFFAVYPGVRDFQTAAVNDARNRGFVTTLNGRQRPLPDAKLTGPGAYMKRSYAERQAVNTIIQGSAADLIKAAMQTATKRLLAEGLLDRCRCCLQIHDELVFEVEPSVLDRCSEIVRSSMAKCRSLRVPMPVKMSVGTSWGSMEDLPDPKPSAMEGAGGGAVQVARGCRDVVKEQVSRGESSPGSELIGKAVTAVQQTSVPRSECLQSPSSSDAAIYRGRGTVRAAEERIASQKEAVAKSTDAGTAPDMEQSGVSENCDADKNRGSKTTLDVDDLFDFGSSRSNPNAVGPEIDADVAEGRATGSEGVAGSHTKSAVPVLDTPSGVRSAACAVPSDGGAQLEAARTSHSAESVADGSQSLEQRGVPLFSRPRAPFQTQNGATSELMRGGATKNTPAQQEDLNELAEIAKTGLNLRPFTGSRLAGASFGQPWSQHKTLASALLDDDADNLELDD